MRIFTLLFLCFIINRSLAQVNGGEQVFEFLRVAESPHITALGGIAISNPASDIMMTTANPALLRPEFHTGLSMAYQTYYAGTKISNCLYAYHVKSIATTFALGISDFNYGNFRTTDDIGNFTGDARAREDAFHLSASRAYLSKWRYGITCTYATSRLIDQHAAALLTDIGVLYADTSNQWYFGAGVKNAGILLKNYEANFTQPLPLDLQIGTTKKFKKAPFSINILAHHLQSWNIRYDNPADQTTNTLLFADSSNTKTKTYFADKLFRHFVFALDVKLGKHLEISAGYNHMRRSELAIAEKKGMSGFSYGVGLYLHKFIVHFAQSYYHIAGPTTEVGLTFKLNQLIGVHSGESINWSEKFANTYK